MRHLISSRLEARESVSIKKRDSSFYHVYYAGYYAAVASSACSSKRESLVSDSVLIAISGLAFVIHDHWTINNAWLHESLILFWRWIM